MTIMTRKTWGPVRLRRIHDAWNKWKARHPGVYSEPYAHAGSDAGDWCANVHLAVRQPDGSMISGSVTTPKGRCSWHPKLQVPHPELRGTKEEALDEALRQFERECETL